MAEITRNCNNYNNDDKNEADDEMGRSKKFTGGDNKQA